MEQSTTTTTTAPTPTTPTTPSYYERNKHRIKARYAEKKTQLVAYQMAYYADNIEKQQSYNAMYYQRHRAEILSNKSMKVCCLRCRRIISERQITPHRKTAICSQSRL